MIVTGISFPAAWMSAQFVTRVEISSGGETRSWSLVHAGPDAQEGGSDADGNGLPDSWEREHYGHTGENPEEDPDGDGMRNRQEWLAGTDPNHADSDRDGIPDGQEQALGTNPADANEQAVTTLTWLSRVTYSSYVPEQSMGTPGVQGFASDSTNRYLQFHWQRTLAGAPEGDGSYSLSAVFDAANPSLWRITNEDPRYWSFAAQDRFDFSQHWTAQRANYLRFAAEYGQVLSDTQASWKLAREGVNVSGEPLRYTESFEVTLEQVGQEAKRPGYFQNHTDDWVALPPGGFQFDTYSAQAEYCILAPAGRTRKVKWFEIFTPLDDPERPIYTEREWSRDGDTSPTFSFVWQGNRDGEYTAWLFDEPPAVDANRDGLISLTSESMQDSTDPMRPYRFWANDDNDQGDLKAGSSDDVPLPSDSSLRDAWDEQVDGIRDLVDFFPVCLELKPLLDNFSPRSAEYTYRLRHADEALGVVFTNLVRSEGFEPLHGPVSRLESGFGRGLDRGAGRAEVVRITAAGIDLAKASPAFMERLIEVGGGVILVEASRPTRMPLVLELLHGDELIAAQSLELKIDPVESMYRYHNVRSLAQGTPIALDNRGPGFELGKPGTTAAPNDPFVAERSRRNVVFVHGYNVNAYQARGWAAEAFKRFYWAGSQARFHALLWRGDDGQGEGPAPAGATPDYHRNVGHAWAQAAAFRDYLETLEGPTAVVAHSLGNVVTQVALTHERDPSRTDRWLAAARPPGVVAYCALNAALPLEAVESSAITGTSKALMAHSAWKGYDERLWSTHWHRLFPSSDARSRLTWSEVFARLDCGTNFYSSGEEVLANPDDDGTPLLEPLLSGGRHAWVSQEKNKGGAALAADLFRSRFGGWGFNPEWQIEPTPHLLPGSFGYVAPRNRSSSEAREDSVPSTLLPGKPFFRRFQARESDGFYPGYTGERLHAAVSDAAASDEAAKAVTKAKCLAEGLPALSFALGSNPSARFADHSFRGNFDMNTDFQPSDRSGFRNGWPQSRQTSPESRNWRHSDWINVAYTYVHPLFKTMVEHGSLHAAP
ncbi:MAG: hypothetical protein JNG83_05165 [Opitutaceae bacterium]|nr:hypothetical protein [Opitutaceae bacterium]